MSPPTAAPPEPAGSTAAVLLLAGCTGQPGGGTDADATTPSDTVTLVTHDSFALSDGILEEFEEETGLTVTVNAAGDAGTLANQLVLTKDAPLGDAVFGIDNTFASRVTDEGVLAGDLVQIDRGDVCINADKEWFAEQSLDVPETLADLTEPAYQGLLVVTNPATSSPGLAFLLATVGAFGETGFGDYWQALRENDVKIVDSWEDAYFVDFSAADGQGDRPLVLSYSTSPAYTVNDAGESTTSALLETCFRQEEYAGVLAGGGPPPRAPGGGARGGRRARRPGGRRRPAAAAAAPPGRGRGAGRRRGGRGGGGPRRRGEAPEVAPELDGSTHVDIAASDPCLAYFQLVQPPFGEGIVRLNDSEYGLQAGVFTNRLENALTAFERQPGQRAELVVAPAIEKTARPAVGNPFASVERAPWLSMTSRPAAARSKIVNSAGLPLASRSLCGLPIAFLGAVEAAVTTSSRSMPSACSFDMVVARSQTAPSSERLCRSVEIVVGFRPRSSAILPTSKEKLAPPWPTSSTIPRSAASSASL
jgi:thiamine transport system substrate-binding protein